jgi:hypothetical protein
MDRRKLLGRIGASAAGLFVASASAVRAQQQEHEHEGHKPTEHMKILGECIRACNEASHHCLEHLRMGTGEHRDHHAKAHELTMDCQSFCVLAATLMARSSPLAAYAHQACAEACRCCAEECEKGQGEIMKDCATRCRECEQMCRSMSRSVSQEKTATLR